LNFQGFLGIRRVDANLHPHPYFSKVTAFPRKLPENHRQTLTHHRRDGPGAGGQRQGVVGDFGHADAVCNGTREVPANGGRELSLRAGAQMPRRDGGIRGQDAAQGLWGCWLGH
jgi:hypothetical protein